MVLPNRPSNNTPIPNNPFYSPLSDYLDAASGPLVVGSGLTVNYQTGEIEVLISATPVTGLQAGTGINIANLGSGVFEISSTGVQGLIPGYGITISPQPFGQYLISTTCSQGTVTSVTAGAGLTGGIITTAGTIALRIIDPPVSGCYVYPTNMTVDTYGRVTAVTQGVPSIPVSLFGSKGQLAVGVGPSQAVALPVGANSLVLTADSACPTGIKWAPVGETAVSCVQGTAPICVSGPSFSPTISIQPATLTSCGAVRLINSTNNSSADAALTAAAGCCLQQQINALAPYSGTVSSVSVVSPLVVSGNPTVNPTIAVCSASTLGPGVVQLNDTTCSSSNTQALTANQGRALQNQINALATGLGANLAGTFDGSLNQVINVTPTGTSLGFVPGNPLPVASPANASYYVIIEVPGIMTPPGGVPTSVGVGDWWLSDGFVWVFLNVGASPPTASTTAQGIVELATNAETQAGTDTSRAIVPSALQSKVSDCCNLASSTTIASSQAVKSVYDIAITGGPYATQTSAGSICIATASETFNGFALDKAVTPATLQSKMSDSTTTPNSCVIASALAVATVNALAAGAVQNCSVTNCGQILVGCQSGCVRPFPTAPNNGCVLTSCSFSPYGLCWAPPAGGGGGGTVTAITAGTGLSGGTITGCGTIAIANTGVIAGNYDFGQSQYDVCINSQGQIVSAIFTRNLYARTTVGITGFCFNSALGACASCMGSFNVAVGFCSGTNIQSCDTFTNSVFVGCAAGAGCFAPGLSPRCSSGNVAIGAGALRDFVCVTDSVAIGCRSLANGGFSVVAVGAGAGDRLDPVSRFVVAVGNESLLTDPSDAAPLTCRTVSVGSCSLGFSNIDPEISDTTALGFSAGCRMRSAIGNVSVGACAGACSHGENATFVGSLAGFGHAYNNNADGGLFNVFVGHSAGASDCPSLGMCRSVAIGALAAGGAAFGNLNTIVGFESAALGINGSCNVVLGACNIFQGVVGDCNIFIGNANAGGGAIYNQVIYIGNNLFSDSGTIPGIGCCKVVAMGGVGYGYKIFGNWCNVSDQKFKTCVCDSALGLSFLEKIQPREFTWCYDTENSVNGKRCVGIVAQEVLQAVCATSCAEHLGVVEVTEDTHWSSPTAFTWPLINAVKELSAENTALKTRLDDLEARLTALGG